jgi:tetratricopeptide (TPR) repeat protein
VRRLPRWSALIRAREIPATFRFTVEAGAETVPLDRRPAGSPVPECEWRRRLGDLFFDLDGGKLDRARAAYEQALLVPACLAAADEASLTAWLGADALATKSYDRALPYLDRALALDPSTNESSAQTLANRALAYEGLGRAGEAAHDWTHLLDHPSSPTLTALAKTRLRLLGLPQQESGQARIP